MDSGIKTSSAGSQMKHTTTPAGSIMPSTKIFESLTSDLCALCGMGATHNLGTKKEEIISHQPVSFHQDNGVLIGSSLNLVPGLVRCSARGCFVTFHPMCAVLATRLGDDNAQADSLKSNRKEKDRDSSMGYTLTLVNVERRNEISAEKCETIIPIAFCALHHSLREEFCGQIAH